MCASLYSSWNILISSLPKSSGTQIPMFIQNFFMYLRKMTMFYVLDVNHLERSSGKSAVTKQCNPGHVWYKLIKSLNVQMDKSIFVTLRLNHEIQVFPVIKYIILKACNICWHNIKVQHFESLWQFILTLIQCMKLWVNLWENNAILICRHSVWWKCPLGAKEWNRFSNVWIWHHCHNIVSLADINVLTLLVWWPHCCLFK